MTTTDVNDDVFEKANAYDNAIRKAKELLSKCKRAYDRRTMVYRAEDIEYIFPELKDSDNERIRKRNHIVFQTNGVCDRRKCGKSHKMACWLESMKKNPDKNNISIFDILLDG
jgi:hypothetical protein